MNCCPFDRLVGVDRRPERSNRRRSLRERIVSTAITASTRTLCANIHTHHPVRRRRPGTHRAGRRASRIRPCPPKLAVDAVVSGDRTKRREIAKRYRLDCAFDYNEFDECLQSVDAVYIALPNSMHADYAIRAARAGVHVLCEKPMAVTAAECRQMIAACRRAKVKLMIAYRLHFETLKLSAMDLARSGRLGELKFFNSSFSMTVRRGDIRTKRACGGGTLYDIGIYGINAARNLFRAEPTQVSAIRQQRLINTVGDRRNDGCHPAVRQRASGDVRDEL